MRVGKWLFAAMAALLIAASCETSSPDPAPSPGPTTETSSAQPSTPQAAGVEIAVVLPPPDEAIDIHAPGTDDQGGPDGFDERLTRGIVDARLAVASDVAGLRTVTPDTVIYRRDLIALMADEGADLVCVIGATAVTEVVAVAEQFPATRFCIVPATIQNPPPNVLAIGIRGSDGDYLAGAAAALASGPAGRAGVIADGQATIDALRGAFEAGVREAVPGQGPPVLGFPVPDIAAADGLTRLQFEGGVGAIYTRAGAANIGVVDAANELAMPVVAREGSLVDESGEPLTEPPPSLLVSVVEDPGPGLALAFQRIVSGWEGGSLELGVAEGAVLPQAGPDPRAEGVMERLSALIARIRSGEVPGPPVP